MFDLWVFGLCVFDLWMFDLWMFGLCVFDLCVFGLCVFGLCVFDLCVFGLCVFDLHILIVRIIIVVFNYNSVIQSIVYFCMIFETNLYFSYIIHNTHHRCKWSTEHNCRKCTLKGTK